MLYGTDAWEVNMSYPRGFVTICCACGKGQGIDLRGEMFNPQAENEFTTAPVQMCVIIECKECSQIVRVFPGGRSQIIQESDRVKEYQDTLNASLKD
jgi:hypothetical protein